MSEYESASTGLIARQKAYFDTGATLPLEARRAALASLRAAIHSHEGALTDALHTDLGKSAQEAAMTEIRLTLSELSWMEKHLGGLMKPRRAKTPLSLFPASSRIYRQPYGQTLIMSPWNYPVLLTLSPLIAALAAGNTAVVKPSAYAAQTSEALKALIEEAFQPELAAVITGGRAANQDLLEQKFDYIFFTGGKTVGRLVMEKAAVHLTPVTLELGGKSPCVVTESAELKTAARRIVFGKYLNAGQTCVAPDYLLVQKSVKAELMPLIQAEIRKQFGEDPMKNPDYGHIVNERHFERVAGLMRGEKLLAGGQTDQAALRIAPTVLDEITLDSPVMGEEIFGPLLPVLTYDTLDEAIEMIRRNPTPLAAYLFTQDKAQEERFTALVSYGGGCVNDTIMHLATDDMPFGGVGQSGMGNYHGKWGFETFSHEKSVLKQGKWPELMMRYQPYSRGKMGIIKRFLK